LGGPAHGGRLSVALFERRVVSVYGHAPPAALGRLAPGRGDVDQTPAGAGAGVPVRSLVARRAGRPARAGGAAGDWPGAVWIANGFRLPIGDALRWRRHGQPLVDPLR